MLSDALDRRYRQVRAALERVPAMRGAILTAVALKDLALDEPRDEPARLDGVFAAAVDPLGFERPAEAVRFDRAEQLLEAPGVARSFGRAFEIGCAEGHFTARLAPRCGRVLAVDISATAVARARARCTPYGNVECRPWNLRHDPVPGSFDLIVAVGVLEYIRSPFTLRAVREKLVAALPPGGHLLAGTTVSPFDDTWVGRVFVRGTWIHGFLGQDARLTPVAIARDECARPFEHMLYRRCGER